MDEGFEVEHWEFFQEHQLKSKQPERLLTNPHHDIAMLRYIFEVDGVQRFAGFTSNGDVLRRVVDVGGSTRLAESGLAGTVLWPITGHQDHFREMKRLTVQKSLQESPFKDRFSISRDTFKEYMNGNPDYSALFVFTDTLYYIKPEELKMLEKSTYKNAVIATGNMHLFLGDGTIHIGDTVYGTVWLKNDDVYMQVKGNENVYQHKNYYKHLVDHDEMAIPVKDGNIVITVTRRVNLGATDYIQFVVTFAKQISQYKISRNKQKFALVDNKCSIVEGFNDNRGLILPKNFSIIPTFNNGFILKRTIKGQIDATKVALNDRNLFTWEDYHSVILEKQTYDFEVSEKLVNDAVSKLMTQDKIDSDVIKQTLKLLMNKTPANPEQFLIPIIVQALQDTMRIEVLVNKICKSELVSNINNVKNGGVEVSYFGAILQKIFGENNTSNGNTLNPVSRDGKVLKKFKNLIFNEEKNTHGEVRQLNTLEIESQTKTRPKSIITTVVKKLSKCFSKNEVKMTSHTTKVDGVHKSLDIGQKQLPLHTDLSIITGAHQLSIITTPKKSDNTMNDITSIFKIHNNSPEYLTVEKKNSNGTSISNYIKFKNKEDELEDIISERPKNNCFNKQYILKEEVKVNNMSDLISNICSKCDKNFVNCNCKNYVKNQNDFVLINELEAAKDDVEVVKTENKTDEKQEEQIDEVINAETLAEYGYGDEYACNLCTHHEIGGDCTCDQCQELYNRHWVDKKNKFNMNLFNKWYDLTITQQKHTCSVCHFCKSPECYDDPNNYEEVEDGGPSTD